MWFGTKHHTVQTPLMKNLLAGDFLSTHNGMTSLCFLVPVLLTAIAGVAHASDYVVEAYFVVEPQVVKNYENLGYQNQTALQTIRGDMDFVIDQVNKYFGSMKKDGLDIEVRMTKLNMMPQAIFQKGQVVSGPEALTYFQTYLKNHSLPGDLHYDIAVLLTGFDITGARGNPHTAGYAHIRAMCNSVRAVAVAEFTGTQVSAMTIAHELAHSLGAGHDQSVKCPSSDGYIMTTSYNALAKNRWSFSACSIDGIKKYLTQLNKGDNCLTTTTANKSTFDISSQYDRDIMNPEKVCQRLLGHVDSYFCNLRVLYKNKMPKGDPVCQSIFCGRKRSTTCRTATATEGMICDVGKRCQQGKCIVDAPTPEHVKSDCIYGDLQSNLYQKFRGDCSGYIKYKGVRTCYVPYVRAFCCQTCASKETGIKGCEYGDSSRGCKNYPLDAVCPSAKIGCCYTCRNWKQAEKV